MEQTVEEIRIDDLHLWTENPRDPINENLGDLEIIKRAIKNYDKWNLPKLIKEMGDFYHLNKLPIVVEKNNKYIVYDGNCRIALLKYAQNPEWSRQIEGTLFPSSIPEDFKNRTKIMCAVCDEKTAFEIIYQDAVRDNRWNALQLSYFEHYHLKKEKDTFLKFEESTGIISNNPKMNQRFVKEENITEEKLNKLGFAFNESNKLISSYSENQGESILKELIEVFNNKEIDTRKNRGQIVEVLTKDQKLGQIIKPFDEKINNSVIDYKQKNIEKEQRKTKKTSSKNESLFGEKLILISGDVNNLYSILDEVYERFRDNDHILPIIGMSLRLLMEVAAREAYPEEFKNEKKLLNKFIKKIKEECKKNNFLSENDNAFASLDGNLFGKADNFEAYLNKYAHGEIHYDKTNILTNAKIVARILQYYFPRR